MDTSPTIGTRTMPAHTKTTLRLLVVEDHHDLCVMLELFLDGLGCEARVVRDVASALHAADEGPFDVLLCDIALPDGDGWSLLGQLEKTGHRPRYAIAMSCHGLSNDRAKSVAAGFATHLAKPFPPEALEAALQTARLAEAA